MPNLSYDGQSFLIDARRQWLVSASLNYSQIAPQNWPTSIAAARQAGMNCIEVIVPWRIHEPHQGKFHFSGQANLRQFVQLIIAQGMYVILRPGPYIANHQDLGGLPSWLLAQPDIQLRQANPAFLQASARYLGKVMAQVHDLQLTSPRLDDAPETNADGSESQSDDAAADAPTRRAKPAGIIMIQAEHQWLCHHPDQSNKYLTQIVRYLRENNCQVPITLSNNLWQQVDGTLDTWHASSHLAADLRQLRMIQPSSPRFVSHLAPAARVDDLLTQITSVLAVGGQFNLDPFCASSLPAVNQGRTLTPATSSTEASASPVRASDGSRSDRYHAVKRVATLASQFGHVFAHALPASQPAALLPEVNSAASQLSILQQQGSQGTLIFLIKSAGCKTTTANVLLPDGQTLPVPLGNDAVAWIGADINLSGVAQLTLTNLRPWAWIAKKMLVLFGPADAQGLIVLNGASLTFNVPSAKQPPAILHHDDITLVILNEKQIDAAYPTQQGLIINAASLDENDQPVHSANASASKTSPSLIDLSGAFTTLTPAKTSGPTKLPTLSPWQRLDLSDMLTGKNASFKPIKTLASMEAQGDDTPACWYHLKLKSPVAAIPTLASPASGGCLHFYTNQKHTGTLNAQHTAKIKLAKEFVVLAANPGRYADGWRMHETVGLSNHLYAIKPVKLSRPKIAAQVLDSPLTFRPYLQDIRHEHREMAQTLTWSVSLRSKVPRIFAWENFPHRSMLLVNGQIVGVYDPALSDHAQQVLLEMDAPLRSGSNELTLALLEPLETLTAASAATLLKQIKLYEVTRTLTDNAEVHYAQWALPDAEAFDGSSSKTKSAGTSSQAPCWRRSTFNSDDNTTNLQLTISAAAGSQIYLNHHPIGRVNVNGDTHTFTLPASMLHTDKPNELLFFDAQPGKAITARLHK